LNPYAALIHGACLIFIDSLSSDITFNYSDNRELCVNYLFETIDQITNMNIKKIYFEDMGQFFLNDKYLKCGPFYMLKNKDFMENHSFDISKYYLNSPTTSSNVMRLMRCFQMDNPIMLEGR
jgi:midasin